MKSREVWFHRLLFAVLIALLLAGAASAQKPEPPAAAQPDRAAPPPGGQDPDAGIPQGSPAPEDASPSATTIYMHISGAAFVPAYYDSQPYYAPNGCTFAYTGTLSVHALYNLPIVLPPGSALSQLRFYYRDTSAVYNSTMYLREMDDGQGQTIVTQVSSAGSSGYNFNTVDFSETMDYVNFSYLLQWQANMSGYGMQLCAVRIGYTPPLGQIGLLPAILRNPAP